MGKLLDYGNLGLNLYQSKQLSSISAAQNQLGMASMMDSIKGDMEVEKRKLMLQFETEIEELSFETSPVEGVAKVVQIRSATDNLDLTTSGFREFADMDRAKSFSKMLTDLESKMKSEVSTEDIKMGRIIHQYVSEDDDLEEYAALQHIKEAEDEENSSSGKVVMWALAAGLLGMIITMIVLSAVGIETEDVNEEPTDAFFASFCGTSILLLFALWKPLGMSFEFIKGFFSSEASDAAKEVLKKRGGQESLDAHISTYGEMNSKEVIVERIRRLEIVGQHTSSTE